MVCRRWNGDRGAQPEVDRPPDPIAHADRHLVCEELVRPNRRLGVAAPWSKARGVRNENDWVEVGPSRREGLTLGRMYKTGDKVTVPDPDGNGRIAATFLNTADDTVTIADSSVAGNEREANTAWIRYEEGEAAGLTERFTFAELRPVDQ
jgi:hypothetical protein